MCGIFGAINLTGKWHPDTIKGLTWANRERGTDSLGFFDASGRTIKRAGDPATSLMDVKLQRWLDMSAKHTWAIGGHTRLATQGAINKRNAHPFKYGKIVGTHNGMVEAPYTYEVDSEVLFDTLDKTGLKGLESERGYWGLAWYNKKEDLFYLTCHSAQLGYVVRDGVLYYSSDRKHLASIVGGAPIEVDEGQVICVDSAGNVLDSNQGHIDAIDAKYDYNYYQLGYAGGTSCTGGTKIRTYSYYKDDDENEFREVWSEYLHSMTDEEFTAWEGRIE